MVLLCVVLLLQISRPDGKPDQLGLNVLDEPCAKQSDPTVLDLQLRSISKQTNIKPVVRVTVLNARERVKTRTNCQDIILCP